MKKLIGRVLWWSEKDSFGIVVDTSGNEFYFDSSSIKTKKYLKIAKNSFVRFSFDQNVIDTLCANNIEILKTKEKAKYRKDIKLLSF